MSPQLLTKLVGLYFQLLGHEFLWGVLGPPIESACNSTLLKSNVHDLTPAEQQAHEEEELSLCQQLSDMVVMNVIRFPPTLHRITRYLFLTVEAKFPDFGVTVIRSFVFLRFICLAIIDPHRFGLMGELPVCLLPPLRYLAVFRVAPLRRGAPCTSPVTSPRPLASFLVSRVECWPPPQRGSSHALMLLSTPWRQITRQRRKSPRSWSWWRR